MVQSEREQGMQETDEMKLWRGVKICKRQKQIQHSKLIAGSTFIFNRHVRKIYHS